MGLRQVTAFLPSPVDEVVDDVRRLWDPEMAYRIAAHITLVHNLGDVANHERFDALANEGQAELRLTAAHCWGEPSTGIYLGVEDERNDIARLRSALAVEGPPGVNYEPHVTLVHSRTTTAERSSDAWRKLAGWRLDVAVVIRTLDVIEFDGSRWRRAFPIHLNR